MKRFVSFIIALSGVLAVSCQKDNAPAVEPAGDGEIVFSLGNGFDATVTTKATAITALPSSLYWAATSGSRGVASETKKWDVNAASAKAVTNTNKLATGQYQTATATAYNYYVANNAITVPATGNVTLVVPNNNTDVIAGWVAGTTSTTPSITLNHIFARTGTFSMAAQDGYSISNVTWTIVGKSSINGTAGTYNLSAGNWSATSATLASRSVDNSSDLYLIPGTYTISCTYTLSKGGSGQYSETFTKSADVTLVGGKVNNISGKASGGTASEIVLTINLTAWGEENHDNLNFV